MGDKRHIKVSTKDLEESATQLKRLQDEFEHSSQLMAEFRGFIGSGELADKLDDFASNWKIHREKLCKQIELLGKTAETAAKAYDGIDAHLAATLEKSYASAKKSEG
jgi:hypothetical protein